MPVFVEFCVQCDRCSNGDTVRVNVTNVQGEPKFKLDPPKGWKFRDLGSLRTQVTCYSCLSKGADPLPQLEKDD